MGEPPHVPVGLDDLRPQDVVLLILPHGHRLQAAVKLKGLWAQLQDWGNDDDDDGGAEEGRERLRLNRVGGLGGWTKEGREWKEQINKS